MWIVYIIFSRMKKKTYVGSTDNFQRRLMQHNNNEVFSTKGFGPWQPIYIELYKNQASARNREKILKTTAGRRYLRKVINDIINDWGS